MNATPSHAAHPALRCPKCAADMATYERSGIIVDQCRECRGIFLDRGELERLVDAESAGWAGPQMQAPAPAPLPRVTEPRPMPGDPRAGRLDWRDDDDDDDDRDRDRERDYRRGDWDDRGRWDGRGKPRKRTGILGELLESLGD